MGKTSKWIRNFLTGKKEREKDKKSVITDNPTTTPMAILPPSTPREKRRWSFRRSSATNCPKDLGCTDAGIPTTPPPAGVSAAELENDQKKHAMAMAAATAAAADAAVAAAQAVAEVIRLTSVAAGRASIVEEAAAVKIQSVFRAYLARKALCALKGLVKLQALVRGHLVRKQATATLRCMQALVTVQARARAQRIKMTDEFKPNNTPNQKQLNYRKSTPDNRFRLPYNEMEWGMEENIKIVEMDLGESKGSTKSRNSYSSSHPSHPQADKFDHRFSNYSAPNRPYSSHKHRDVSPSPSAALNETSPRALSSHFEDYSFGTAQSSPQYCSAISKPNEYAESLYNDHPFFPSYMANTESSRAKARSQSAPKSRPEGYEKQPGSRRRVSLEGRNVPRAVRMQRSSSHVGSAAPNFQYPWSVVKLDRSCVSLKDSECGSTSTIQTVQTIQTNNVYCRSLVGLDVNGNRY